MNNTKPPKYNPLAMSSLVYANKYAKKLKRYLDKIKKIKHDNN
jgi:hypothetical protein